VGPLLSSGSTCGSTKGLSLVRTLLRLRLREQEQRRERALFLGRLRTEEQGPLRRQQRGPLRSQER